MVYDNLKAVYTDRLLAWARVLRENNQEPLAEEAAFVAYISARTAEDISRINGAKGYLSSQRLSLADKIMGDSISAHQNLFSFLEGVGADSSPASVSCVNSIADFIIATKAAKQKYSLNLFEELREKL